MLDGVDGLGELDDGEDMVVIERSRVQPLTALRD